MKRDESIGGHPLDDYSETWNKIQWMLCKVEVSDLDPVEQFDRSFFDFEGLAEIEDLKKSKIKVRFWLGRRNESFLIGE